MQFYKRDPDKALTGMAMLTLKQRGAYNSILDLLYSRDGDVPDDDGLIARAISVDVREWKSVKRELIGLGKLWVEDGKLRARRVAETLKDAADFSNLQRARVASRWEKKGDVPLDVGTSTGQLRGDLDESYTLAKRDRSEKDSKNNGAAIPSAVIPYTATATARY